MTKEVQKISWSDDLSVGHKELDEQNKTLIELINHFGRDDLVRQDMERKLEELIGYAARHFNDEEDVIMHEAPEIIVHHVECHAGFIEKSFDFAHRFHEGEGEELRCHVYGFLCDWLVRHIGDEDQQYNKARIIQTVDGPLRQRDRA